MYYTVEYLRPDGSKVKKLIDCPDRFKQDCEDYGYTLISTTRMGR